MIDLVCLVADKNMEAVISAALKRPESLAMRAIVFETVVHPQRDSACYHRPEPLLRPYLTEARHALVVFDRAWEGAPTATAVEMESSVDGVLSRMRSAWAKAIVIDPEVEAWLCRRTPRLDERLGWRERTPALKDALEANGMWPETATKPPDPKRVIEWALHQAARPRSSAIYREIAAVLGMKDCVDLAFGRFRSTLQSWFPAT